MDTSNAYPNNKHLNVLVVIPAYNEQESIVSVVNDVVSAGYDYVVVNDGSTDETQSLCESHGFKRFEPASEPRHRRLRASGS